jgi:hypothetical protein
MNLVCWEVFVRDKNGEKEDWPVGNYGAVLPLLPFG